MAKKKYLKEIYVERINEFLNLLRQNGINISQVILFGSYAKGKPTPDSDIDLVVVSPRFGKNIPKEMMFLRKIAIKVDSRIEPIPLSPNDLKDRYSTFIQEIKQKGKKIALL